MADIAKAGTFTLGDRSVMRIGYGAMQLAGPGVFGPPTDREAALGVLREAVAAGVNHVDTSDFYGPHVTNQLIREALHPYPDDLVIVTKVGASRGKDGSWLPAQAPADLVRGVHDNLRNLGVEVLDVVNLRIANGMHGPTEKSIGKGSPRWLNFNGGDLSGISVSAMSLLPKSSRRSALHRWFACRTTTILCTEPMTR